MDPQLHAEKQQKNWTLGSVQASRLAHPRLFVHKSFLARPYFHFDSDTPHLENNQSRENRFIQTKCTKIPSPKTIVHKLKAEWIRGVLGANVSFPPEAASHSAVTRNGKFVIPGWKMGWEFTPIRPCGDTNPSSIFKKLLWLTMQSTDRVHERCTSQNRLLVI